VPDVIDHVGGRAPSSSEKMPITNSAAAALQCWTVAIQSVQFVLLSFVSDVLIDAYKALVLKSAQVNIADRPLSHMQLQATVHIDIQQKEAKTKR